MNDENREQRLADFMRRNKPDSATALVPWREVIVRMFFAGYTLSLIYRFLEEEGIGCSRRTFYRWVQANIDFEAESAAAQRSNRAQDARSAPGEGVGPARAGPVVQRPLVHDDAPTVSLAGVPADSPLLTGAEPLPKPPILVPGRVDSAASAGSEKAAKLAEARRRREELFQNPVEKALTPRR